MNNEDVDAEGGVDREISARERRWQTRNLIREREEQVRKSERRRSWVKPWLRHFRQAFLYPVEEREDRFRLRTGLPVAPRSLYGRRYPETGPPTLTQEEGSSEGVGTPLGTFGALRTLFDSAAARLQVLTGANNQGNQEEGQLTRRLFEEEEEREELEPEREIEVEEEEEDMAVPNPAMPGVPAVPIVIQMGAATDRTTNVAPLPTFSGWPGADPDQHLSQFLTACVANNGRTEDVWLRWFPATLKEVAFDWYNRQAVGHFANWTTLRDAFLTHFRPVGYEDRLRERLINSRMIPGEAVESYYGRVADIIRRWPNNNLPESFVLSILVNGLYPPELRMFVKEVRPVTVAASLLRAKLWEECHFDPVLSIGSTMIPVDGVKGPSWMEALGNYSRPTMLPNTTRAYPAGIINATPLQSLPPSVVYPPYQDLPPRLEGSKPGSMLTGQDGPNEQLLLNLTKRMEDLAVNMAKDKEKRPKQTNFRPNVWCTNCKGQGHMNTECPSPVNQKVQCQICGKSHPTESCWHLARSQVYAGQPMIPITPWDVNQVQAQNGYNWNKQNNQQNNQYKNNRGNNYEANAQQWIKNQNTDNGGNTGQPGSFTKATWNVPSRFIPVPVSEIPGGNTKRPVRCFRCRQMGHYASECTNERATDDYVPICGNCKQNGHTTSECNAPFNFNNKDQHMQSTNPADASKGPIEGSPVNRVELVAAVQTRSNKGKIIFPDEIEKNKETEPGLTLRKERRVTKILPRVLPPGTEPILLGDVPRASSPKSNERTINTDAPVHTEPPQIITDRYPVKKAQNGHPLLPELLPLPRERIPKGGTDKVKRKKKALGISANLQHYDIMKDLDEIRPSISMRQLLAIAPDCRTALNASLVRRRIRNKDIHEVALNPDPGAPMIDVSIDGVLVPGVQVDGGSSVNLMTAETAETLGLTSISPTALTLRMADHSRVKPVGVVRNILTIIAGHEFNIDYVVFKLPRSASSYPILLGRPWLYNAKAKNDWGKGTLTLGKGGDKIVLQMYPVKYHGESQVPLTEVTSEVDMSGCSSEDLEEFDPIIMDCRSGQQGFNLVYQCGQPGEYIVDQFDTDNSDHAIAKWMNNYDVKMVSNLEPDLEDTNPSDFITDPGEDVPLEEDYTGEPTCRQVDIGTDGKRQPIKLYDGINGQMLVIWTDFFRAHKSSFAWTYEDLKGVPPEIGEHRIHLKENTKPIRQRQHRLNPKYSLMVKEELDKLLRVGFIYPVPYSEWVSSMVMVPKKNGKLRICQDYRQLNAVTLKDYFPLPFTDSILDAVAGHECYSFLDGFSGYNQVQIAKEDRLKTTFTTDWGTFAYKVMPFGLCNAPATFQRIMTQAFQKYLRISMEIFLDDFCVFSSKADHLDWLDKCLIQCAQFGISLNSEKCTFGVPYGKLLGHIVSAKGIATDPDKVRRIADLPRPVTVTGVRGFVGHVSYYRRYIEFFARICQPLTNLLKKPTEDTEPVWTHECTVAFETLKQKLLTSPILIPPDWNKMFHVYVDASDVAIGSVLSQKDDKGFDHPIYYSSRQLNPAERNYTVTEREALGMIYSVQKFRHYLLGYAFVFHVDHDALKYMVNKPQLSGRIARWVLLLQEFTFTIEVRPGKKHANADHLSRLTTELGTEAIPDALPDAHLFAVEVVSQEYAVLIQYLTTQSFPITFTEKMKQNLIEKSIPYTMIEDVLYKKGKDGLLRRCIFQSEVQMILDGCHKDCCGGHFAGDSTTRKALTSGYWWPNLFKDAHRYTRHCDPCQRVGRPTSSSAMPLVPILAQAPFEKWGIDFVGPIAPASRNGQKRYILVATEYVTKWAEASAVRSDNASTVAKFLYENIITRFGCPKELVSDRGTHFINSTIQALTDKYEIKHRKTTPYHPRANGQTEKTNGILCKILTKTIMGTGTDWDIKLFAALWAYRTAYKVTTQSTPFQLVYGTEAIIPIELEIPSLRIAIRDRLGDTESLQQRLTELEKLDETRANAFLVMEAIQKRRKSYYDSKLKKKTFTVNDYVLLYDSRYLDFPGKFQLRWHGPYKVTEVFQNGSIQLEDYEGKQLATRINGNRLKLYYQPNPGRVLG